jgi:hypothetical protein
LWRHREEQWHSGFWYSAFPVAVSIVVEPKPDWPSGPLAIDGVEYLKNFGYDLAAFQRPVTSFKEAMDVG